MSESVGHTTEVSLPLRIQHFIPIIIRYNNPSERLHLVIIRSVKVLFLMLGIEVQIASLLHPERRVGEPGK